MHSSTDHWPAAIFLPGSRRRFSPLLVKKPGLDITDVCSYRPISNLSVLSKLLVTRQLKDFLTSADLLPPLQSGFRPGHSTETAVLQVLSDILQAVDRGNSAALFLLDLSAAFHTVENEILLQRLLVTFSIHDTVHRWFQSHLLGRTQYVRRRLLKSLITCQTCGVLKGQCWSPVIHFVHRRSDVIDQGQRLFTSSVR